MPSHGAAAAAPTPPAPTQDRHKDTNHLGWQGMRTGTGHPGGGTQRVGYLVTDGENTDGDVPQQPVGIQREARCGTPILCRWITGRRGVGDTRPDQREGERGHALPRTNVVSCESVGMVSDGYSVGGLETVSDKVLMVVMVL